jgi:hypothetical protein
MATSKHTPSGRPIKRWADFPLFPARHRPLGQEDRQDAEAVYKLYQNQKDDLEAGRTPTPLVLLGISIL